MRQGVHVKSDCNLKEYMQIVNVKSDWHNITVRLHIYDLHVLHNITVRFHIYDLHVLHSITV